MLHPIHVCAARRASSLLPSPEFLVSTTLGTLEGPFLRFITRYLERLARWYSAPVFLGRTHAMRGKPGLAWLVLLTAAVVAGAQAPNRKLPAVLLISIDGLRPDYVTQADKHGLRIPNLRRFLIDGAYATGVHGVLPTVTYPSHPTRITGVSPAKHGIFDNHPFDPFDKNQSGWTWYAEDIRVPTLWDAAGAAGLGTANVHWPVSVGAKLTYNLAQILRAGNEEDRKLLGALS